MGNVESSEYWGDQIEHFLDYGPAARLTLRSIKLFADGQFRWFSIYRLSCGLYRLISIGALGSWGAALQEPYSDKPDSKGLLLTTPENLSNLVQRFWDDGFQVARISMRLPCDYGLNTSTRFRIFTASATWRTTLS